jgi:hypothetical protein
VAILTRCHILDIFKTGSDDGGVITDTVVDKDTLTGRIGGTSILLTPNGSVVLRPVVMGVVLVAVVMTAKLSDAGAGPSGLCESTSKSLEVSDVERLEVYPRRITSFGHMEVSSFLKLGCDRGLLILLAVLRDKPRTELILVIDTSKNQTQMERNH